MIESTITKYCVTIFVSYLLLIKLFPSYAHTKNVSFGIKATIDQLKQLKIIANSMYHILVEDLLNNCFELISDLQALKETFQSKNIVKHKQELVCLFLYLCFVVVFPMIKTKKILDNLVNNK